MAIDKKFEEIIKEGKASGKTYAEINKGLKAAGANFHLDENGGVIHWTKKEMEEGFISQPAKTEDVKRELDTSRRIDLKGKTDIQTIAGGVTYEVTYDEEGYFRKAHKI